MCIHPQCNRENLYGGVYCALHQEICDTIAFEKMLDGEPLPEGNRLKERFEHMFKKQKQLEH